MALNRTRTHHRRRTRPAHRARRPDRGRRPDGPRPGHTRSRHRQDTLQRGRTRGPQGLLLTVLAALALTLTACTPGAASPGADGDWTLTSGQGPDGQIEIVDGHAPTMIVDGFEVTGNAGCNQFGVAGDDEDDDPGQWPTEFFSTMMACPDQAVMDQEAAFLTAMGQITSVQVDGDHLVLTGPDTELHFERTSR